MTKLRMRRRRIEPKPVAIVALKITTPDTAAKFAEFNRILREGCGGCEFEEADGSLMSHCGKCQCAITVLAYSLFVNVSAEVLKPCPSCGNDKAPRLADPREAYDYDYRRKPGEADGEGFIIICDASEDGPGGCGMSTGWAKTKRQACALWNRRAP